MTDNIHSYIYDINSNDSDKNDKNDKNDIKKNFLLASYPSYSDNELLEIRKDSPIKEKNISLTLPPPSVLNTIPETNISNKNIGCSVEGIYKCFTTSICNILWCGIPCTKTECIRAITCKQKMSTYIIALIWYGSICSGLYLLYRYEIYDNYWKFLESEKTVALIIIVCTIFLLLSIIQTCLISYPEDGGEPEQDGRSKSFVVIAAHNSGKEIGKTVYSLLTTLNPEQIYIADNGNSPTPTDNTKEIVVNLGLPEENYYYIPIASKVNALYTTALDVKEKNDHNGIEYKYIGLLDDDTMVPDNFRIDEDLFEDNSVSALSYGIQVHNPKNIVEKLVDWEYKLFCWRNYWRGKLATLRFAVGIFSVWRLDRFIEVYKLNPCHHPGLPFGEDGWSGLINREHGYKIKQELRYTVSTFAPPKLFPTIVTNCVDRIQGYGAQHLWKQRAYRWYRNYLRRFPREFRMFIIYNPGTIIGWIFYRLDYIYGLFLFFGATTLPIMLIRVILSQEDIVMWIALHSGLYGSGCLSNFVINYWAFYNRSNLKTSIWILLLYPIFTLWIAISRMFGFLGTILYYIPCVRSSNGFNVRN